MAITPTGAQTALIALYAVLAYDEEKGSRKFRSRFNVSLRALRKIARRDYLRDSFLMEFEDELRRRGWLGIRNNDYYSIVRKSVTEDWSRIGVGRETVAEKLERMENDDDSVFDEMEAALKRAERARKEDDDSEAA
jgi:hypothetical protein